jgi:hypothetical protein
MLQQPSLVCLAGLLTAAFTVYWSVDVITSDLLMSGFLLLGISKTLVAGASTRRKPALWAGLLFGFAYLAKSVALPVSIGLIVTLHGLRTVTRAQPLRVSLAAVTFTLLTLALIALPWILTLSRHYGSLTFSTSVQINYAIVGPSDLARYHPYVRSHHAPPGGRITSWEDPDPKSYEAWSPITDLASFKHQLLVLWYNLKMTTTFLRSFDFIGIGLPAAILGFLFAGKEGLRNDSWRASALIISVAAGAYLPVHASELRYFFACYPLLLTAALCFVRDVARPPEHDGTAVERHGDFRKRGMSKIGVAFVALSFLLAIAGNLKQALHGTQTAGYITAQRIAEALRTAPDGPLASVGEEGGNAFSAALYAAYLSGRPYFGNRIDMPTLDDLTIKHNYFLVVDGGTPLEQQLRQSPLARRIPAADISFGAEFGVVKVYFVIAPS